MKEILVYFVDETGILESFEDTKYLRTKFKIIASAIGNKFNDHHEKLLFFIHFYLQ